MGGLIRVKGNFLNIATSKVSFLAYKGYSELEYLDLSNFDTSNVINMGFMFFKCSKLKEIKGINKFNTDKVKSMYLMFNDCPELNLSNLSNFDQEKFFKIDNTLYENLLKRCNLLKLISIYKNDNN